MMYKMCHPDDFFVIVKPMVLITIGFFYPKKLKVLNQHSIYPLELVVIMNK